MSETITLHGYHLSVYNRIARLALHQKAVSYNRVEVDPFSGVSSEYCKLHPFARVPVLSHGSFNIYETRVITRYIDNVFDGPAMQPETAKALARMDQVIAIIDNYGYWPMVRQVFSNYADNLEGKPSHENEIKSGIKASKKCLEALEKIAIEGHVLNEGFVTLADCHLAPMLDYFVRTKEGREVLADFPAVSEWWSNFSKLEIMHQTKPTLPHMPIQ